MTSIFNLIIITILSSFIFSSSIEKFTISEKLLNQVSISFFNDEVEIFSKDGYDYISENKNSTIEEGFPALPTYSFSYGVNPNKEYNVELNVLSSHTIDNVNVYPYQAPRREESNSLLVVTLAVLG